MVRRTVVSDGGGGAWPQRSAYYLATVATRISREQGDRILRPLGISQELPGLANQLETTRDLLRASNDTQQRYIADTTAMLKVFEGITTTIRSFREASVQRIAARPGVTRNRFWHDGAFTNFVMRFDMLTQLLLQQANSQEELVNERLRLGMTITPPSDPATAASLTFTVGISEEIYYFAARVSSSWLLGDYVGTIMSCRNFIVAFKTKHGPLDELLTARGVSLDRIQAIAEIAEHMEAFVQHPQFEPTRIVHLASVSVTLVDFLRHDSTSRAA